MLKGFIPNFGASLEEPFVLNQVQCNVQLCFHIDLQAIPGKILAFTAPQDLAQLHNILWFVETPEFSHPISWALCVVLPIYESVMLCTVVH